MERRETNLGKIKYERQYLRDVVYEKIKSKILDGTLSEGKKITVTDISNELCISRTPVREALYKLTATGLIKILPHKGFLINSWSVKEVKDVFEVRAVLECLAIELFIKNLSQENIRKLEEMFLIMKEASLENDFIKVAKMNNEFHDYIVDKSNNSEVARLMEQLKNKIEMFRLISISKPSRIKYSLEEHNKIFDSIKKKDVDGAKNNLKIHINKAKNIITNTINAIIIKERKIGINKSIER